MTTPTKTALAAVLAASLLATSAANAADAPANATGSPSGISVLQEKVNKIAEKNGIKAPDVRKELAGKAEATSEEEKEAETREALKNVSPIERIVAIPSETIRAIKSKDGRMMYLVDNGRFVLIGKLVDVWNKKELSTIEEIADAVSHIDLARMGFKLDKVNHISVGTGEKHVVVFVDPQCGWCHKLMDEFNKNPEFRKRYTFDYVVVPVLGERSNQLSKKLFCAKTEDAEEKFRALSAGARAIEALDLKDDCDADVFNQTRVIAQAVGVQGVPMLIAHDGRFTRGKPQDLMAFLEPVSEDVKAAEETAKAASAK